jgi:Spy/CpxP family protein refolding chaperone
MTATVKRLTLGIGVAVLAVGVSAGAFVHAQDGGQRAPFGEGRRGGPGGRGGFGGPGGPMGMLPMLGRDLELTDAQKDQLKAIAESHKDDWKALADRGRTAHMALNDAVMADTINEALIRQKSAEVAAVDADIAVARARARAEVFQILTAEQRAKVKARAANRGRGDRARG